LAPLHTTVVYYFDENPALAVGIVTSGISLGGVVLPFLLQYLIDYYHWRGAFIIIGAMTLNTCVCGALMRPPPDAASAELQAGEAHQKVDLKRSFRNLYTNRSFLLLSVETILIAMGTLISLAHIKAAILEMTDVTDSAATYGISVINGGDFIGVILFGIIFNRSQQVDVVSTVMALYTVFSFALFLFPQVRLYPVLMIYCAVIGVGITPQTSMMPLVLRQFVGLEDLTLAYGCFNIPYGLGTILGPMVAGFTYDSTRDYANSFYIAGVSILISNILLLQPCISNLRKNKCSDCLDRTDSTLDCDGARQNNSSVLSLPNHDAFIHENNFQRITNPIFVDDEIDG
jgi:predicted MFS family arabinose efflux permease